MRSLFSLFFFMVFAFWAGSAFSSDNDSNGIIDECQSPVIDDDGSDSYFDCSSAKISCGESKSFCVSCISPNQYGTVTSCAGKTPKLCSQATLLNGHVVLELSCPIHPYGYNNINQNYACSLKTGACPSPLVNNNGSCICPNINWEINGACLPPSQNPVCTSGENTPVPHECPAGEIWFDLPAPGSCEPDPSAKPPCPYPNVYQAKPDASGFLCVNPLTGCQTSEVKALVSGSLQCMPYTYENSDGGHIECKEYGYNPDTGKLYCIENTCLSGYEPAPPGCGAGCLQKCLGNMIRQSDCQCYMPGQCPSGQTHYDLFGPDGQNGCMPSPDAPNLSDCKSPYGDWLLGDCICNKIPELCRAPKTNECPGANEIYFQGECICDSGYEKVNGVCAAREGGPCGKNAGYDQFRECRCNYGYVRGASGQCEKAETDPDTGCPVGQIKINNECVCPSAQVLGADGRCRTLDADGDGKNDPVDNETFIKKQDQLNTGLSNLASGQAAGNQILNKIKDGQCGGPGQPACNMEIGGLESDIAGDDELSLFSKELITEGMKALVEPITDQLGEIDSKPPVDEGFFSDNLPFVREIKSNFTFSECSNSFTLSAFGHSIVFSFCDKFSDIRIIIGWMFNVFTALTIVSLIRQATSAGGEKL
jgi:hypothetical protein